MADLPQRCPSCGKKLERVRQSANSVLNADQFDAVRAGDWFCQTCPSNGRGWSNVKYWWDRELMEAP